MRAVLTLTVVLLAVHGLVGNAGASGGAAETSTVALVRAHDGTYHPSSRLSEFTLAGLRWRGPGRVELRTRSLDGRWTPWRAGAAEPGDAPDASSGEGRRARSGWHLGSPWWVGASDGIEARALGRVTALRAELVRSLPQSSHYRRLAQVGMPSIVPRSGWNADEAIRRAAPTYAPQIKFVVIHHTAGANDYSRADAPAIVRGIELYHVRSNGWNDIGYNFLVDRFGTIYEGRYGGVDRNVVGAHALGFNTGSVGIAVLGSYGSTAPSRAAQDAVARLIAWRLDLAHVDPTGSVTVVSGGSERYPAGTTVQLRVVSGHRDTGLTECPGDQLYARLGAIATQARALGGPKIFEPAAEVSGAAVRIRARLSASLPWTVAVTTSTGVEVARGTGTGTAVDWTWDSSSAPAGTYTWTVTASSALPATGSVKAGAAVTPPGTLDASVVPDTITPNGDGQADSAVLEYRLTAPAAVTVQLTDVTGAAVATLADNVPAGAGSHTLPVSGDSLPDGRYHLVVTARPVTGAASQTTLPFTVSRSLGFVAVTPTAFSPNGDGRNDTLTVSFSLTEPAVARVVVERDGRWVATPLSGDLPPGPQTMSWDGSRTSGKLRDGSYEAVVEVQDAVGKVSFGVPFTVDTTPPRARFLPGRGIRISVDGPAALVIHVDRATVRRTVRKAGVIRVPWPAPYRRVSVVATDAAGNRSTPLVLTRK
jgi:hypothetical protein